MALQIRKGRWQYRIQVKGHRVSSLTDWEATDENRPKALAEERRHRDAILTGKRKTPRKAGKGFSETSEEFVASMKKLGKPKESSIRRIETSLVSLRIYFRNTDLAKISTFDVEAYTGWRLEGDEDIAAVKKITAKHDLSALSKLFKWAIRMKVFKLESNPVRDAEKPSSPDDEIRMHILTAEEEALYFWRCEQRGYQNLGDVAHLIREQGMKPEEAMHLEWRGIDLERGTVQIFKGKREACRRTLKLTRTSREILARRRQASASRWVFPSPKTETRADQPITKLNNPHNKIKAMGPGLHPDLVLYDFRHTFATRAAAAGMPTTTLKAILGHSSLRMVERYVHPTQTHMDREMERIDALKETGGEARVQ